MQPPRSSGKLVTVFGGSGFIGRYVVHALAKRGHRIRVAVRRPDLAGHLQPLGAVGQIRAVQANLRYRWSIERALEGADAVINLVGIMNPSGRQTYEAVQVFGPRAIAEVARAHGISDLAHMSALGADPDSDIGYIRSKGEGERAVRETVSAAVIFRPSIVFGPEDDFFNRFAGMARLSPVLPLIGGGETRFQPVYAANVGEAFAKAVDRETRAGTIYELGGPEVLTFRQCMELMLRVTSRRRAFVPIPFPLAKFIGRIGAHLPGAPLTYEQARMLERDTVVSEEAKAENRTLEGLRIDPTALEIVLPTYLKRFRERGEFTRVSSSSEVS